MKKQKEIVLYVEGREPAAKKRNTHHDKNVTIQPPARDSENRTNRGAFSSEACCSHKVF
jgi:hypothetical protein